MQFHTVAEHLPRFALSVFLGLAMSAIAGRLGVVYSPDGLNDTGHTEGCCCCGGNELRNAIEINVNVLAYALTY